MREKYDFKLFKYIEIEENTRKMKVSRQAVSGPLSGFYGSLFFPFFSWSWADRGQKLLLL